MSSDSQPLQNTSSKANWALVAIGAAVLAFFYAYIPLFSKGAVSTAGWLVNSWNKETNYEHGFLVPIIMIGLIIYRWADLKKMPHNTAWTGLFVLIGGITLFVLGAWLTQARISVGSFSIVIWGGVLFLFGWRVAWTTFVPIFLLYSAIYIPGLQQATNGLQLIATEIADVGAKLFGIATIRTGNTISSAVEGAWGFDIAEGCSGIRSLMAMVLISVVYAYIAKLAFWKKIVVCLMAIPLAIMVNAIRITTILMIADLGYEEFAKGIYHDYAPFFIFPLGITGLLLVHAILQWPDRRKTRVVIKRTGSDAAPSSD